MSGPDFAWLVRGLLGDRQMSAKALAQQIPVDAGHLSRVLNGKRRPSLDLAAGCDRVFATGDLLTQTVHRQAAAPADTGQPGDDVTVVEALAARRRVLLDGIAMVAAAAGLFDTTPTTATAARRRVGRTDVARIEAVTAFFDAGCHTDAQRHFLSAERAALAAGNTLLTARVRYCQARQFQHLRHNRDALNTLTLARDHLGTAATPAVNAMLHGARAASQAAVGDHHAAVASLNQASGEYERIRPDGEPAWMGFFDHGELLAQYGRVYRDLARDDPRHGHQAVTWVRQAIAGIEPANVRSTVLNEIGLCSALFLADEPEEALTVGQRVLDQTPHLTSQRVRDRIVNLRRDLNRHTGLPEVAAFTHRLTTAGTGPP